jgi:HAD superfamily hydrolase (TIGR01450 family)
MALADQFDGLLVDLDGVVWVGRETVPGSAETLRGLIEGGKEIVFVTNNPSRAPASYAERLAQLGVAVGPERVVTAGTVAARLAAKAAPGGGAFVLGREALRETVSATGLELLDAAEAEAAGVVVVSGFRDFDYGHLLASKRALDAGAALVGTSRDPTMPMPGGAWPGSGAVLAAVEVASGRTAEIAGKPERHLFELALAAMPGAKRVAMVGDRVSSDIEGGRRAGLETILVLSGATGREEAGRAEPRPDHVVERLADLAQP